MNDTGHRLKSYLLSSLLMVKEMVQELKGKI